MSDDQDYAVNITPAASDRMTRPLSDLARVIQADGDESTPAVKLLFAQHFLDTLAGAVGIDLHPKPITPPDFAAGISSPRSVQIIPATPPAADSPIISSSPPAADNPTHSSPPPAPNTPTHSSPPPAPNTPTHSSPPPAPNTPKHSSSQRYRYRPTKSPKKSSRKTTNTSVARNAIQGSVAPESSSRNENTMLVIAGLNNLTPKMNADSWAAKLKEVAQRIEGQTLDFKTSNKIGEVAITFDEVTRVFDLLFGRTFSDTGLKRALSFIQTYRDSFDSESPIHSIVRAQEHATNEDMPVPVRKFMGFYQTCGWREQNRTTILDQVAKACASYQMYECFLTLASAPENSDIRNAIQGLGFTMARGKSWATSVHGYLADLLDIGAQKFRGFMQRHQIIHQLGSAFGPGILVLLPNGGPNILMRLGTQKLAVFLRIFSEDLIQETQMISDAVGSFILRPFLDGEPIAQLALEVDDEPANILAAVLPTTLIESRGSTIGQTEFQSIEELVITEQAVEVDEDRGAAGGNDYTMAENSDGDNDNNSNGNDNANTNDNEPEGRDEANDAMDIGE